MRPRLPSKEKYSFTCNLFTRLADEDNQKILNHATYIPLMEEARYLYFMACGTITDRGALLPFVQHSTHIRFVAPGSAPAQVKIEMATLHMGATSFTQLYRVSHATTGKVWVEALQTLVMVSHVPGNFKSQPMPLGFREKVVDFERQATGREMSIPGVETKQLKTLRAITEVAQHPGPFRFQLPVKTRWVDEDRHGALSGAIYWTLMEEGRAAYFGKKSLNLMTKENAFPFVLLSSSTRYFNPGHGAQDGLVDVRTTHLGKSSFTQHYRVRHADTGTIWCEAVQIFVMWDVAKKQKMMMPAEFRKKTADYDGLNPNYPPAPPSAVTITRKHPELLNIGDRATIAKTFTEEDVANFAQISEDRNPLHLDPEFAAKTIFKDRIVHGALVGSLFSAILGTKLPGQGTIYMSQKSTFKKPVFFNQRILAHVEVVTIHPTKPVLTLRTWCEDAVTNAVLLSGDAMVRVPKKLIVRAPVSRL